MKRICFILLLVFPAKLLFAQLDGSDVTRNPIFVFPIDSVIKLKNDTLKLVRVVLPPDSYLETNQACIVNGNRRLRDDAVQSVIGTGKFMSVFEGYHVFSIKLANKDTALQKGDLLGIHFYYPAQFKGRIFDLIRGCVYLKTAKGDSVYNFKTALRLNEGQEKMLIRSLLDDIHYVAVEMKKKNDSQDQLIKGGFFNGKKLFDAMETARIEDLDAFLGYVIARSNIYAANAWSISEIFATWMTNGTPVLKK